MQDTRHYLEAQCEAKMKLCLLGVESARNICKNKVMKTNYNKITRFLQLGKTILFATVEALDKKLSEQEVSKSPFDDQSGDLCEPSLLNG